MVRNVKPIVVVGSINIDLVTRARRIPAAGETVAGSDFQTHFGGKGANQAVAVARLGCAVHMIGRVGDDAFGQQLKDGLTSSDVDIAGVQTSPGSSGVATIVVAEGGENSIVVVPGANALLTPDDLDRHVDRIRNAGIVLTQLETPIDTVEHLAQLCRRNDVPLILDPAPARALSSTMLNSVTWFTPNETEAVFFAPQKIVREGTPGQIAEALRNAGVRNVVLKLGARGAFLSMEGSAEASIAPFPVDAVDTTAAGDCFNGAFAAALSSGMDAVHSAQYAAAAASIAVTRIGAQPSMPTAEEVEAKLLAATRGHQTMRHGLGDY